MNTNPLQAALDALKAAKGVLQAVSYLQTATIVLQDVDAAIAALSQVAGEPVEPVAWSKEPPTEQGWYWHWNGDLDHQPIPTSVLYSGTAHSCFMSIGQLGITEAIFCDKYGGYWMRMHEPSVFQGASPQPADQQSSATEASEREAFFRLTRMTVEESEEEREPGFLGKFDLFQAGWQAARQARPHLPEWQPIETAPKDGSRIMVGRPETDESHEISTIGWWQDASDDGIDYMGNDAGFVDIDYQCFTPGRSFGSPAYMYEAVQPTHWKPIPAAPIVGVQSTIQKSSPTELTPEIMRKIQTQTEIGRYICSNWSGAYECFQELYKVMVGVQSNDSDRKG